MKNVHIYRFTIVIFIICSIHFACQGQTNRCEGCTYANNNYDVDTQICNLGILFQCTMQSFGFEWRTVLGDDGKAVENCSEKQELGKAGKMDCEGCYYGNSPRLYSLGAQTCQGNKKMRCVLQNGAYSGARIIEDAVWASCSL